MPVSSAIAVGGQPVSPAGHDTWMSLNTTRPHWLASGTFSGVLKVKYWVEAATGLPSRSWVLLA